MSRKSCQRRQVRLVFVGSTSNCLPRNQEQNMGWNFPTAGGSGLDLDAFLCLHLPRCQNLLAPTLLKRAIEKALSPSVPDCFPLIICLAMHTGPTFRHAGCWTSVLNSTVPAQSACASPGSQPFPFQPASDLQLAAAMMGDSTGLLSFPALIPTVAVRVWSWSGGIAR